MTRPVRVGDYFMKAQIDIVLRDGAYRAMLSALVADTREQIEGASRLVVIDDSGRWTAQWERLVAVARRLAAAAAPPRSAGARR